MEWPGKRGISVCLGGAKIVREAPGWEGDGSLRERCTWVRETLESTEVNQQRRFWLIDSIRTVKVLRVGSPAAAIWSPWDCIHCFFLCQWGCKSFLNFLVKAAFLSHSHHGALEKTDHCKGYHDLLILYILCRVDGRLELCVSLKSQPGQPGNPCWGPA